MITNLLASIIVMIVTNDVPQWQYKQINTYLTYPATVEEIWVESPQWGFPDLHDQKRINPDLKVSEVRRLEFVEFDYGGDRVKVKVKDELMETRRMRRTVKTEEKWESDKGGKINE